jgi:hypothetical protein
MGDKARIRGNRRIARAISPIHGKRYVVFVLMTNLLTI